MVPQVVRIDGETRLISIFSYYMTVGWLSLERIVLAAGKVIYCDNCSNRQYLYEQAYAEGSGAVQTTNDVCAASSRPVRIYSKL